MKLNEDAKHIISVLNNNGFPTYLTGGAIRDHFLNIPCSDFDITTKATSKQIKNIFPQNKVKEGVGKSFAVCLVDGFEVATFRTDHYEDGKYGAHNCKVKVADTIEEDLSRRDLTINAMAYCPLTNRLIDMWNGQEDLANKTIRLVGDPTERLTQDPARVLRACRFLAKLEGSFAPETFQALWNFRYSFKEYLKTERGKHRIRLEILKAMSTLDTPSLFFSAMRQIGVLKFVFYHLDRCFEHEGGVHHIENVGEHCMLAVDNIHKKFLLLRLAAALHDCGKPDSYDTINRTFHKHELEGAKHVRNMLTALLFPKNEIDYISNLVLVHMRTCNHLTPKGIRRLRKDLSELKINPSHYIRLKLADRAANIKNGPHQIGPIRGLIKNSGIRPEEVNVPFTVNDLAIKGGQLIEKFNLSPSPLIGQIMRYLLNRVIDEGLEINIPEKLFIEAEIYIINNSK